MNDLETRLDFACNTARAAGGLALEYFSDLRALTVESKGVQDMATEADVNTENAIRDAITTAYPDDAFLGEESSASFEASDAPGVWIVDPIDGTQPFICGMKTWCISIAYYSQGRIVVAAIYDPTSDEMYAATLGGGATLNGKAMHASDATELGEGLVSVGYSTRVTPAETLEPLRRMLERGGMYHRSGSGALSLAWVADGRLIGYFEPHMCAWDMAAGSLLVREAGGSTNDCLPNDAALKAGGPMIAATAGLYDKLVASIEGD